MAAAAALAIWLAVSPAAAGAAAKSEVSGAYVLAGAEQFTLRSAEGRVYQVLIDRPQTPPPAAGYPVIYLLDPSSAFATLVETVRNQAIYLGPVVVVGVGYPADADGAGRMRDLTPATDRATLPPDNMGRPWGTVGGADAFLSFLLEEVKPAVEARLSIDHRRQALFGHSLGGLFALHVLFTRPDAFQTYVAGSPSIWWGGKAVLAEARAFRAGPAPAGSPRRLLITMGGLESQVTPQEEAALAAWAKPGELELMKRRYRAYVAEIDPVANGRTLARLLANPPAAGLDVRYVEFPDETHNSVIPAYLSRGASFMLSAY